MSSNSLINSQAAVLRRAASAGNHVLVQQLLSQGTPVDIAQEDGCTALWLAAEKGNHDIVQLLCRYGAQVNSIKYSGNVTPTYIASQNGHTEVIRALIMHNADIDIAKTTGATPLFIAAQQSFSEIVSILLNAGANIGAKNHMGITPLMIASYQGHEAVVSKLLRHGADPYAVGGGRNALEWAMANNQYEKIKAVVDGLQRGHSPLRPRNNVDSPPVRFNGPGGAAPPDGQSSLFSPLRRATTPPTQDRIHLTPGGKTLTDSKISPIRANSERAKSATRPAAPQQSVASPHPAVSRFGVSPSPFLKVEERRANAFRNESKQYQSRHHMNIRSGSPDYLRSSGLNTNQKAIDAEWIAYKHRLLNQQQVLGDTKFDLEDSWMYSWSACREYMDKTNKLRQEEMEAKTSIQAAPALADVPPGVVPPILNQTSEARLRVLMEQGIGAKPPPAQVVFAPNDPAAKRGELLSRLATRPKYN